MIAYDFSNESQRVRGNIYNLFSPAGRAHLASLLVKEKEVLENFVMSYETPELRRLAAQASRRELTEEEQLLLKKSPKSFKGVISSGGMIEGDKAIKVVTEYADCLDIVEDDLKILNTFIGSEGQPNTEIILGKQMSYWNLHPNQFALAVYDSIFDSPEYTKQELIKLYKIKAGGDKVKKTSKVFTKKKEVEELLNNFNGTELEKLTLTKKILSLEAGPDTSPGEYKNIVVKAVEILLEKDAEFDFTVYSAVKDSLPQYHNKKLKYFIYLLSQYNLTQSLPVSSRIDAQTIHAFYRKADELCSS